MTLRDIIFNELERYNDYVWSTDGIVDFDDLADNLTDKVEMFCKQKGE